MVEAIGSPSWIDWMVEATPGGIQAAGLLDWLFEKRRLRRWRVMPAAVMALVLAAGYLVLGSLTLWGVDIRRGRIEPLVGGCMVAALVVVAYMMRRRD